MQAAPEDVEDVLELSPMQQGMLFHSLSAPGAGLYFQQLDFPLHPLQLPAFRQAWEMIFARHAALRVSFHWQGFEKPLQVVHRRVPLPLETLDWQHLAPAEQAAAFDALRAAERQAGFDPARAPLVRFKLVRCGTEAWRFLMSHHHALLDGWSLGIVMNELGACYEALSNGRVPRLGPPRAYADYIRWLQRQDLDEAGRFWRAELAGFRSPTVIPLPGGSAAASATTWEAQDVLLPVALADALQDFARTHRLTLNTLVQGAWALVLGGYCGSEDVLFGVTVAGRPPELEGVAEIVGTFINTLPLRLRLAPGQGTLDWLKSVQARHLAASRYDFSPLTQVQAWSELPRGVALFESILVFQNQPGPGGLPAGASERIRRQPAADRTGYPLTLSVVPGPSSSASPASLWLNLMYEQPRFEAAAIERLIGHLQAALAALLRQPALPLRALDFLGAAELRQLEAFEGCAGPPGPRPVQDYFDLQAARAPAAIALEGAAGQVWSYAELGARAAALSARLRRHGVGPGQIVGLCLRRSPEALVAILAVLKSGAAYLPLDPSYPQARLDYMLADSGATLLLTSAELAPRFPADGPPRLLPDPPAAPQAPDAPARSAPGLPEPGELPRRTPTALAYLIYTSGSTGRPKGVAMPHGALANLIEWQLGARKSPPERAAGALRTAQCAPLGFDVSFQEMFSCWAAGGTLVLIDEETRRDPAALLGTLASARIQRLYLPGSLLTLLAEAAGPGHPLPDLREVITAGEALRITAPVRRFFADRPGCRLHNHYGPSETHVVSALVLPDDPAGWPLLPSIGRPIDGVRIRLLDPWLRPVPVGIPGHLHIGGAALAAGYPGHPALTAERFIPDPAHPEARLYRSGDLASWTESGELRFLGRADEQLKLRGYRIEPGEIEALLASHPQVGEAVVTASPAGAGGPQLIAWWQARTPPAEPEGAPGSAGPRPSDVPDAAALRAFLARALPEFMLPARFVRVDAFPQTPSGKLDRRALQAAPAGPAERTAAFVAPRNDTEARIAAIWAELTGAGPISAFDHFFADLGGHSLLAARVVFRLQEEFGLDLPLRALFDTPTLASLADALLARQAERVDEATLASLLAELEREPGPGEWPASVEDKLP